MTWDVTLDFEYVVTQKEPPRICFGTGLERDVLPTKTKYQNPFMRRNATETRDNVGPGTYQNDRDAFYDVAHRHYSTAGLGSKSPRWTVKHEYQPPIKELPKPEKPKQNCAPFNQTSKRKGIFKPKDYPAEAYVQQWTSYGRDDESVFCSTFLFFLRPCDYWPDYKRLEMKFAYSFSGKKVLRCAVSIKCVPYNLDECGACGCSCSAQGDYWQFEDRIFLCRKHYSRLFKHCLSKFQGAKLTEFKSVRDCFFMHAHNSCKAALKIMKSEEIVKKLRKEAYLDLFFPQRRICNN